MLSYITLTFAILLGAGALARPTIRTTTPFKCLDDREAIEIATKWNRLFATDEKSRYLGATGLNDTLAGNFTYWNDGDYWGPLALKARGAPVPRSRADWREHLSSIPLEGPGRPDYPDHSRKVSIEYVWHDCLDIFLRSISTSVASRSENVTASPGTEVVIKGASHIVVDWQTRLIHNTTSSVDMVNWALQLGFNLSPAQLLVACVDPKQEGCEG